MWIQFAHRVQRNYSGVTVVALDIVMGCCLWLYCQRKGELGKGSFKKAAAKKVKDNHTAPVVNMAELSPNQHRDKKFPSHVAL